MIPPHPPSIRGERRKGDRCATSRDVKRYRKIEFYQANFDDPVQSIIDENQINVIVVNPEQEVITRWIN